MGRRWIASAATILVSCSVLFAHDLYLMPDTFTVAKDHVIVVSLHNGDSFPESEVAPVLDRVRDMRVVSATGSVEVEHLETAGKVVQGKVTLPWSSSSMVTARTSPHAFELQAAEFEAYLKEEGLFQVIQWRHDNGQQASLGRERYRKYAKSLINSSESHGNSASNNFHTQPVGLELEIVPEKSPENLKPGSAVLLQVLFRGKPASDLQVEAAWAGIGAGSGKTTVLGRTDKSGRIIASLPSPGKWRFHTVRMERCEEPSAADWESYWSSLTFEIH
jgi:uncharacterized GH25 family protein